MTKKDLFQSLFKLRLLPFDVHKHFVERQEERNVPDEVVAEMIRCLANYACQVVFICSISEVSRCRVYFKGYVFVFKLSTKHYATLQTVYRSYVRGEKAELILVQNS